MSSVNWFGQSLIATFLLVPAWLSIGFFNLNYQVKSDVFLIWYFAGVIITSVLFGESPINVIMPSWKLVGAMLLIGITVGGVANILLFRAVVDAPNPGLPIVIANTASIFVFLFTVLFSRLMPNYFNYAKADIWSFIGMLFTIIGISIIAIRR